MPTATGTERRQGLPPARIPRVDRILRSPLMSRVKPSEAQAEAFRKMAMVADPLADDLVVAMHRLPKGEGRHQFEQAVDHGVQTVEDPLPELVAFMAALDDVPYWVDFAKIEKAQRFFARVPLRSITMLTVPGFIMTYSAVRPNQVLVRTGGLEDGASSRIAETLAWLVACTQPGGMGRFSEGFRSCARVRLVHAYVRSAMTGLDDWDYEAWDHPANQAQQSLTMLPFVMASPVLFALGHVHTPRESAAIMHLLRYMSHVVGVRPELQIDTLNDLARLAWLALWSELEPDQYSPRLTKAALDATDTMYDLPTGPLAAPVRWAARRLNADLAVMATGLTGRKAMGLPRLSPMVLALPAVIGANIAGEVARAVVPGGTRIQAAIGARRRTTAMAKIVDRSKADLAFNKDDMHHRVNQRVSNGATKTPTLISA